MVKAPAVPEGHPEEDHEEDELHRPKTSKPATTSEKVAVALFVVALTALSCWGLLYSAGRVEEFASGEHAVSWKAPAGLRLQPGPLTFRHDREGGRLLHRGPVSETARDQLLVLIEAAGERTADGTDANDPRVIASYRDAVEELAYESNRASETPFLLVFLLGGFAGMLGAQARSLWLFVQVATYWNILDVRRWWPWYAVRPVLGFVLGSILVALVQAQILNPSAGVESANEGPGWLWMGLTFLVGFVGQDFCKRLVDVAQTAFGMSAEKRS